MAIYRDFKSAHDIHADLPDEYIQVLLDLRSSRAVTCPRYWHHVADALLDVKVLRGSFRKWGIGHQTSSTLAHLGGTGLDRL